MAIRLNAAAHLGARPVLLQLRHRLNLASGQARRALPDAPAIAGPFFASNPATAPRATPLATPAPPRIDWHGGFDRHRHALDIAPLGGGDIRPVWERNRLAPLLRLAAAGEQAGAEALLADWAAQNPAFRGPAWICGQEAALRALTLALAHHLLHNPAGLAPAPPPPPLRASGTPPPPVAPTPPSFDLAAPPPPSLTSTLPPGTTTPPSPALAALLALHAERIAATPAYAAAQDNNHPISEAAGLLVCGLLLGHPRWERQGARRLLRATARLIAPCGAFAQPSARYHRLLLDTLAVTALLWRAHRGEAADAALRPRAAAATAWARRLIDPATGRLPRLGPEDPSCFADLAEAGPDDARASLARAEALFGTLPLPRDAWISAGWRGWQAGRFRAILRTGTPRRFRPAHADLLHLDLWLGPENLLRDGGSGSYNPPAAPPWNQVDLAAARAHNLVTFDDAEPMPRATRFLFAQWPRARLIEHGAETRDARGMRHARRIHLTPEALMVEDRIAGPFRRATLRWRLAPGDWRLAGASLTGPLARITITADAPLALRLAPGWESPAYGSLAPVPVLEARLDAPGTRLATRVEPC